MRRFILIAIATALTSVAAISVRPCYSALRKFLDADGDLVEFGAERALCHDLQRGSMSVSIVSSESHTPAITASEALRRSDLGAPPVGTDRGEAPRHPNGCRWLSS